MDWSDQHVLKFLNAYENEPLIWDPKHQLHRNKTEIKCAWLRLAQILHRPVTELRKKKECLMTTFRIHLKRKKAFMASGAGGDYKCSWFPYACMESFLAPVYDSKVYKADTFKGDKKLDWSNETVLQFLEAYKNEPQIWDSKHLLHKNKMEIKHSWLRISNILNKPIEELKKKKECLMSTFRLQLKRKNTFLTAGAKDYKSSWFAFDFMESFLAPIYNCNPTHDDVEAVDNPEEIHLSNNDDIDNNGNNLNVESESSNRRKASNTIPSSYTRRRRRRHCCLNPPDVETEQMKSILNKLDNVINSKRLLEEEDACDLYGRLLAKKLRPFSEDERNEIMLEIDGFVVARARQNCDKEQSFTNFTVCAFCLTAGVRLSSDTDNLTLVNAITQDQNDSDT